MQRATAQASLVRSSRSCCVGFGPVTSPPRLFRPQCPIVDSKDLGLKDVGLKNVGFKELGFKDARCMSQVRV